MKHRWLYGVLLGLMLHTAGARAETVALWLFDEQAGLYPSCVLGDAATGHLPLVLGLGGQLVEGKFGRALEPSLQPNSDFPSRHLSINFGGLRKRKKADQDEEQVKSATETFDPDDPFDLSWRNAHFCALMTRGQTHLRKEVAFASPTRSRLNLGNFDWTVEFWCLPIRNAALGGLLIEMGTGPRGATDQVTRIALDASGRNWLLENRASATTCEILTDSQIFTTSDATWHHVALVYDSANQQIRHFVDGKQHSLTDACALEPLPPGELDYLSIGRDGNWQNPFPGRIDELRVSDHQVYTRDFSPPDTFSQLYRSGYARAPLRAGPAPLFGADVSPGDAIQVGSRKVLFVDDALIGETEDVEIRVNPPRLVGRVYKNFGTHLTVFQDDAGQIRLYGQGPKNSLAVIVSDDGETWKVPDLGREFHGATNVVIEDLVGSGTLFVDPNAPSDQRIKYFSGYRGRGQYIYSSPDGLRFERNETSALPVRGASQ